jgi:hypothetical protein
MYSNGFLGPSKKEEETENEEQLEDENKVLISLTLPAFEISNSPYFCVESLVEFNFSTPSRNGLD